MDDRQIIADFVIESREHLCDIENQLLAIEAAGADVDLELVNTVFRAVHSVKGAACFLGFTTLGQLAHNLENVLNLVRNQQLVPDGAVTDVLLRAADTLRTLIEDIDHSNAVDVSDHVAALQNVVVQLLAEEIPQTPVAVAAPAAGDAVAADACDVANAPAVESENAFACAESFELTPEAAAPASPLLQAARSPQLACQSPDPPAVKSEARPAAAPARRAQAAESAAGGESNIRVAVNVLDRLMNLAGELVLSRNQLLQALAFTDQASLGSVAARVNQVTSELQETIMQTRLQPIGTVFGRFPRVVRDLSNSLGKQCHLTLEGQEVELDKSIIEAISDPLTHLIRNAVDHGIESPEKRTAAGKSPAGGITLRAFHSAGKVNIQIVDDGRGIDVVRLKENAIAKGQLTPEQARALSEREALQLIFRPGFSTAERVTEVSGRGVGMDVVKTNIERLGGTVVVDTQLGAGTTIHVKLPLTLAIIPSLVVRCGGQRYAIPQASIRELVRVNAGDVARRIERVKQAEVFRLRGALLPLIRLGSTLRLGDSLAAAAGRAVNIIVVEAGHVRYGLIVDGLCDSEEIVVKPLGRHMKGSPCLAGATILGDGKVALILDIAGIAQYSQLAAPEEDAAGEAASRETADEGQALLLFSNHPGEFFGLPMALVERLERMPAQQIDSVGGQQILQYRGGTLPLLALEQAIGCKPRPETEQVYIVVYRAADREVGLVVRELLDIREVPTQIDTITFREPGVAGSLVYEKMTLRLLDLHEMTRKAHPDWYENQPPAARSAEGRAARVLVVDDSEFFRKRLMSFLEDEGYEVEGCEDGVAAWAAMQQRGATFAMVVTDIEMPNMNGLELARRIRDDDRFADLPIIAVSSLAGDDDIQRGRESGVTEYHVKLDREQLMASVGRLLAASQHTAEAGTAR